MKYSNIAGVLRWSEGTIRLHRGQSIDDDHALVKERPELFDDEAPGAEIQGPAVRVESGMQRPGEVRTERGGPAPIKAAPPRGSRA